MAIYLMNPHAGHLMPKILPGPNKFPLASSPGSCFISIANRIFLGQLMDMQDLPIWMTHDQSPSHMEGNLVSCSPPKPGFYWYGMVYITELMFYLRFSLLLLYNLPSTLFCHLACFSLFLTKKAMILICWLPDRWISIQLPGCISIIFIEEIFRVNFGLGEIQNPLELPMVKDFNFNQEHRTNWTMIWDPIVSPPIKELFDALPQPKYAIAPAWQLAISILISKCITSCEGISHRVIFLH